MGKPRSYCVELQRTGEAWDHPKQHHVPQGDSKEEEDPGHHHHRRDRPEAQVGQNETPKLEEDTGLGRGDPVRIRLRAHMGMVAVMRLLERRVGQGRIHGRAGGSNGIVEPGVTRTEGAVHGIVCGDEQTDIEPGHSQDTRDHPDRIRPLIR